MINYPSLTRLLPLIAASALLAACAGSGVTRDTTSQAALKERVQQRWQLLIDKQGAKAYTYLTPGYRQTISEAQYAARMNNRPIDWSGAKLGELACKQPATCDVHVFVAYSMLVPGMSQDITSVAPLTEQWLLLDNQWYYLPQLRGTGLDKGERAVREMLQKVTPSVEEIRRRHEAAKVGETQSSQDGGQQEKAASGEATHAQADGGKSGT